MKRCGTARRPSLAATLLVAAVLSSGGIANAQTPSGSTQAPSAGATAASDGANADALFEEGLSLLDDKNYPEACKALQKSNEQDPAVGAMYQLGRCMELQSKLASAWYWYKKSSSLASTRGELDRKKVADDAQQAVLGRLSTLSIDVEAFAGSSSVTVTLNGRDVPEGQRGRAVARDGGEYTVVASAEGYQDYTQTITLATEGEKRALTIPALLPVAPQAPPPTKTPKPVSRVEQQVAAAKTVPNTHPTAPEPRWHRPVGAPVWVSGAATLAFGAGAIITGVIYENQRQSYESWNSPLCVDCEARRRGVEATGIANIVFVAGTAVSATLTTVLVILRPRVPVEEVASVGGWATSDGGGMVLGGAW